MLLCACALGTPGKLSFNNLPTTGDWLRAQRELAACETQASAIFMADFGFFHPQCVQLLQIGPREYRVVGRERIQLKEGPLWLIEVIKANKVYWVPIPWHDWV